MRVRVRVGGEGRHLVEELGQALRRDGAAPLVIEQAEGRREVLGAFALRIGRAAHVGAVVGVEDDGEEEVGEAEDA